MNPKELALLKAFIAYSIFLEEVQKELEDLLVEIYEIFPEGQIIEMVEKAKKRAM